MMVDYYDNLKNTIIKMLQSKLNIPILNSPIEKPPKNKKFTFPLMLFKSYVNDSKNKINVILYEDYDKYNKTTIPIINNNLDNLYVDINNTLYKIKNYNDGVLELEENVDNLSEYNDFINIVEENEKNIFNKDFIIVTSPYNYNKTMNLKTVVNFRRFQIDLFLYDDLDEKKYMYYTTIIHKLFERDFQILDKNNNKIKGQFAYIHNQLSFDVREYNISNKIISGSMLIRTYNN